MHHHVPAQALACVSAEYIMSPLSPEGHMYGGTPGSYRSDEAVSTQRRQWSTDEDEAVRRLVSIHGTRSWRLVAENLNDRTGKQCRERCAPVPASPPPVSWAAPLTASTNRHMQTRRLRGCARRPYPFPAPARAGAGSLRHTTH